jgi:hypothetical protein
MQSRRMSVVESATKMLITGSAGILTNYYLLHKFWNLPPTLFDSFTMAFWFGAQSFVLTYLIRRFFNGIG